jgi:hypothetical protein
VPAWHGLEHVSKQESAQMRTYQIKFTDKKGFLLDGDEFSAANDGAAYLVAKQLFDACSELYANYVLLWRAGQRSKLVFNSSVVSTDDYGRPRSYGWATIRGAIPDIQALVLERDSFLHASRSAIARSQRFLNAFTELSALAGHATGAKPPAPQAAASLAPRSPASRSA